MLSADRPDRNRPPSRSRCLLALLALAVPLVLLTDPMMAADLGLRPTRHDPPVVFKGDDPFSVSPGALALPGPRPSADDLDRLFLDDDVAPPPSALRVPQATADDRSIVRIGQARRDRSVADGRVERPEARPGSAGELPGGDPEGGLVVVRQDLSDLITQVARFYGFDAVLTRQVRGDVENETLPSDLNAFIARLTADRELVFYFRNRDLNVSAREENVSRVIGLGPSDPDELRAAIEAAGVDADRFPLRFIEASNSALVEGPPSFVALVEVIAESLVRAPREEPAVTVIRGNRVDRQDPAPTPAPAPFTPPAPTEAEAAQ